MCKNSFISFPNFGLSFFRRQANCTAHVLAREAQIYAGHQIFEHIPTCIQDIVLYERIQVYFSLLPLTYIF